MWNGRHWNTQLTPPFVEPITSDRIARSGALTVWQQG